MKFFVSWLIIYLYENMALPQWFVDALVIESNEGKALQKQIADLQALQASDKALIEELKPLAESVPALLQKIAELEANFINREEAIAAISEINPSPVGDAAVTEVVENPEIPTPEIIEQAPDVAPEVVQDAEVVQAAAELL